MKVFKNSWSVALLLLAIVCNGVLSSCSDDDKLSDLTGLLSFGFSDEALADYEFVIGDDNVITNEIALPYGFDASALTPVFSSVPMSTVYIGETEQLSGSASIDFSDDVVYKVVAENGSNQVSYTVRVNVATDITAWSNLSPDAKFPDYTSVVAFEAGGKYFIMGGKKGASGIGGHTYGIFSSTDGSDFSEVNTNIFKEYGMGLGAATVSHDGKQLLIGGYTPSDYEVWGETGNGAGINAVWSTEDGETWTKVNEGAAAEQTFSARTNASVVNMNGDLYLTGGYSVAFGAPQQPMADVWKSTDGGATWTNLNAEFGEDFTPRGDGQLIAYNDELYLIGGRTGFPYTYFNEIYKSADGVTWTKLNVSVPFTERASFSCFVYNSRIFVVAGLSTKEVTEGENTTNVDVLHNDMWVSEDGGISWTEMNSGALPAGFAKRYGQAIIVNDNTVHIFGGNGVDAEDNAKSYTDAWKGVLN
ncbi:DUF6242 domain-containing protein [Marinifilum caeruleilacunae]|uniref:Exo-alpha-sialidase n=1 Tax=Marinifilum caeruleilacunae TaxID=2499076 RepID=A0ABX1WTA6_9BACT|nr:DUF6242 domain-containing protein [Marinifilum caeruleilacunae]NOU59313.1 exo-alpha-sialidase [Marinifilum caeruleilacunae]